jgi:peptidoglycan/LPS O-acetylase OafA/YrhL
VAGKARKRLDIEGLRAIAIVAVILDHLVAWPSGGFVGVDVFFVISGFLITALLLREHERTGTISFNDFYKRRIRRIMPASTLVLVVTVAVSYFLFNAGRFTATALDALSALFFAGNWRFAATGTDYFQSTAAPSPVQHFWSIAVEEQFYFVWPWLMLLIFALVGRRALGDHRRSHLFAGGVMLLLTVGSFAWAMYESVNAPTLAYFSTFSRTWELGVGALLAVFGMNLLRINDAIRPFLAWAGLAGILVSLFVINGELTFPAPWAALPVISTALVIAAGTGGERRGLAVLRNPVMAHLGKTRTRCTCGTSPSSSSLRHYSATPTRRSTSRQRSRRSCCPSHPSTSSRTRSVARRGSPASRGTNATSGGRTVVAGTARRTWESSWLPWASSCSACP